MKKSLIRTAVIGLAGLFASTLTANAQCSAFATVMNTVTTNGGTASFVSDATLSDGSSFYFHADDIFGITAYVLSGNQILDFSGWYEDSNGTATMTNTGGDILTVACASNGYVQITIAGPTFDTISWIVTPYLESSLPGDKCACSGTTTQTIQCDQDACDHTTKCSKNGYCQAGTTPVKMPAGEPQ